MKTDPEEHLLDDLFVGAAEAETRRTFLETTLRAARRRRQGRQAGRVLAAATVIAAIALPLWRGMPNGTRHESQTSAFGKRAAGIASFQLVQTRALPPSMMVESNPGNVHWVETPPPRGRATLLRSTDIPRMVPTVASSLEGCSVVETASFKDTFKPINDEQLLALAGAGPVALVRDREGEARLLLLASGLEAGSNPRN